MLWSLITIHSQGEVYGLGTLFSSVAANTYEFPCAWECLSELISPIQYWIASLPSLLGISVCQGMSRQSWWRRLFSVPQCALESWKHTGVVLSVLDVSWKINAIKTVPQGQFFCPAPSPLVSSLRHGWGADSWPALQQEFSGWCQEKLTSLICYWDSTAQQTWCYCINSHRWFFSSYSISLFYLTKCRMSKYVISVQLLFSLFQITLQQLLSLACFHECCTKNWVFAKASAHLFLFSWQLIHRSWIFIFYCIFMSCSGPIMLPAQALHKNVFLSQVTVFY